MSLSLVGVPSLLSWLSLPGSPLYSGAVQRGQAYKGVSASAWITDVGGPGGPSWWLALATFAGLALVVPGARTLFRGPLSVPMSLAVALFTTVVAAPHVMVYDLVLMLPALPVLAATAWTASTRVTLAGIFVLTWLTPLLHTVAGRVPWPLSLLGAPWAALLVVILWTGILREQRRFEHWTLGFACEPGWVVGAPSVVGAPGTAVTLVLLCLALLVEAAIGSTPRGSRPEHLEARSSLRTCGCPPS